MEDIRLGTAVGIAHEFNETTLRFISRPNRVHAFQLVAFQAIIVLKHGRIADDPAYFNHCVGDRMLARHQRM